MEKSFCFRLAVACRIQMLWKLFLQCQHLAACTFWVQFYEAALKLLLDLNHMNLWIGWAAQFSASFPFPSDYGKCKYFKLLFWCFEVGGTYICIFLRSFSLDLRHIRAFNSQQHGCREKLREQSWLQQVLQISSPFYMGLLSYFDPPFLNISEITAIFQKYFCEVCLMLLECLEVF